MVGEHYHIGVCSKTHYEEITISEKDGQWELFDDTDNPDGEIVGSMNTKEEAAEMAFIRLLSRFKDCQPVFGAGCLSEEATKKIFEKVKADRDS